MKRIFPVLAIFVLAACAVPTQTQTSEFSKNSEVSTPTAPPVISTQEKSTPTPTPIPLPSFSRAELDSMDEAQKIAQAPSVDE
ncbi:MAG: hypothetical protein LC099_02495, partial [Anaerolineales bacterium]|nr:hypothetical protein [Anaerolineales bacterium]